MFKPSLRKLWWLFLVAGLCGAMVALVSCGGNTSGGSAATTGTVNTFLSDPPTPSCQQSISTVYVTVTKVTANISSTAGPSDSGWQTLVDLTKTPKQVNLFSLENMATGGTQCILDQLGASQGLPPGTYQQIRFYLLDNAATGVTISPAGASNACGPDNSTGPFNCVVPQMASGPGSPETLLLSSEAQTGIKIPGSQITQGGFTVKAGQATDLNITFDTCDSLVHQGNNQWRLKPVLHAGEVAPNNNALQGVVVDASNNNAPIPGATVLLEQPDANGIDRVQNSKLTGADGGFFFCGLAAGNYDVVVDAMTVSTGATPVTTTYNATVAFSVPLGTSLGNIPLTPETTTVAGSLPATINGTVTTAGQAEDVEIAPLLQLTPTGATTSVQVTIPVFGSPLPPQPPVFTTATGASCPAGTDCTTYSVQVPAGVPTVGTFASGSITFGASTNPVNFTINGHSDLCTTDGSATVGTVTAGQPTAVATDVALTSCTAPPTP